MGHDRLRRLLIVGIVLPTAARFTVFSRGGTIGTFAVKVVVSASAIAIVAFSVRQFVLRWRYGATVPVLKWGLLLLILLDIGLSFLLPKSGPAGDVVAMVGTLSLITLVVLAIKDTARTPPPHGSSPTFR